MSIQWFSIILFMSLHDQVNYGQYQMEPDDFEPFEKRAWNSGFVGGMGKRAWNSGFNSKKYLVAVINECLNEMCTN